jgi:polyhydroxybutyrate depolymerase
MKRLLIALVLCLGVGFFARAQETWRLDWQGTSRLALVDFPPSKPGQVGLPAVFVLHGWGLKASEMRDSATQFHRLGDSVGFVTVYPEGINLAWNSGIGDNKGWPAPNVDDVGFISKIIDSLISRFAIDTLRVYACGSSNGGFMSLKLAALLSHRIAAVASVSGVMTPSNATNYCARRPVPLLMIHGTADEAVPFYGGVTNWYSVLETVNFWIGVNNCYTKPDSMAQPNLDPNDQSTVVKYIYRSPTPTSEVQLLKVLNGGHTWPSSYVIWPGGGATNKDIIANNEIWNFVKRFTRGAISSSYAHDVVVDRRYGRPGKDSVSVTSVLTNPLRHVVSLSVMITDTMGVMRDSVLLYNDGRHGDGSAGDSVWGGRFRVPSDEGVFSVSVLTADTTQGLLVRLPYAQRIFTNGPVSFKGWTSTTIDTVARPGSTLRLKLLLGNDGKSDKVKNVVAVLSLLDTLILLGTVTQLTYGDLSPSQQSFSQAVQPLKIQPYCPPNAKARLLIKISSQGLPAWVDTVSILVQPAATEVAMEKTSPLEFALLQNYPNPFNPSTSFEFRVSSFGLVSLRIFDALGREVATLINESKAPGVYRLTWDAGALSSGVYFFRMSAGSFAETKKLVLLR